MDPLTYIGILDFNGHLQRELKTRFCCRGHFSSHCENERVPVYRYIYI